MKGGRGKSVHPSGSNVGGAIRMPIRTLAEIISRNEGAAEGSLHRSSFSHCGEG